MRHLTVGRRAPALLILSLALMLLAGCAAQPVAGGGIEALAVETFLADIAQNVAGERLTIASLMPIGVDPHGFEATPQDVMKAANSDVLIVNGAGLEEFLDDLLKNAGGQRLVIEASVGLTSRQPGAGEIRDEDIEGDPHFWLDPTQVIRYVENIRDGLSQADPAGADLYAANAAAYIEKLNALDVWIAAQVQQIPPERRLLATNHESFGYFADRYGFKIVGALMPGVSTGASPSAQQLASLIEHIKAAGAPAIFLETGANPQLAQQIAGETGIKVVTTLYTHSITDANGPAPTYIDMMKSNTQAIVDALR